MFLIEQIRLILTVFLAKFLTALVRGLKLGAASVLPGQLARLLYPNLLPLLAAQVNAVILIVGTNGKTTTSLLLRTLLESGGSQVVHNSTGANLVNGLVSALIEQTDSLGRLRADYAILEVDENILPLVLKELQPRLIVALNLFRDQLDRYGEIDIISKRWLEAIAPLSKDTLVFLNADDPTLSYLGQQLEQQVLYFGLSEPKLYLEEIPHAVDSIYCPRCGHPLDYQGVYLSHLGDYACSACGFAKSQLALNSAEWPQILIGVYNKYNTLAAALVALTLGLERTKIEQGIGDFKAAFGRAEKLVIQGKQVCILLSKNPVGLNETIRTVKDIQKQDQANVTLIILNDRTPDGTDISWIWDVDTENLLSLGGTVVISGDRVYDMALRLTYSLEVNSSSQLVIEEDLTKAINKALDLTPADETLHIIPTYSAMLEVRQFLTGRAIR